MSWWPAIGAWALIALSAYLGSKFLVWVITGGPTGRSQCFRDPGKPCSPEKCECWDFEQLKRQQYLADQREKHQ